MDHLNTKKALLQVIIKNKPFYWFYWGERRFHMPLHPGSRWNIFYMSLLWVSYCSMTSRFPPFPALLNVLGFLRHLLFRIMMVASRFLLLSSEEVNEFSGKLENKNTNIRGEMSTVVFVGMYLWRINWNTWLNGHWT